jgi:hypothetical protein
MALSEEDRAARAAAREQSWEAELEKRAAMNPTEKKEYMAAKFEARKANALLKTEEKASRLVERERKADVKASERRRIDLKKAVTAAKKEAKEARKRAKDAQAALDDDFEDDEGSSGQEQISSEGEIEAPIVITENATMV